MIAFICLYTALFFCYIEGASGSLSARISSQKSYIQSRLIRHNSSDRLTKSCPSTENDQDFETAKSLNTLIQTSLSKLHAPATPGTQASPVPLLPLTHVLIKKDKLLTQAYRALSLFDLVKKRYPNELVTILPHIEECLNFIKQLDPSAQKNDVPESARNSSGRRRLWQELQTTRESFSSVAASSKPTENNEVVPEAKKIKIKHTGRKTKKSSKRRKEEKHKRKHRSRIITKKNTTLPILCSITSMQATELHKRLNILNVKPHATDIVEFKNIIYSTVHAIQPDQYQTAQECADVLFPMFKPLVDCYYAYPDPEELQAPEAALAKAFQVYTWLESRGKKILCSEETRQAINTCSIIVQGIATPRTKRKEERELHNLFIHFTETMQAVDRKLTTIVSGKLQYGDIYDPLAWKPGETVCLQLLLLTAKRLFTKLKRHDDLLRLMQIISRSELAMMPEIKEHLDRTTLKIAQEAQKEREH